MSQKKDTKKSATNEQVVGIALEAAIGQQVRTLRKRLNLTVANVAKQAQLSSGMLSKIENGLTSPSLATLSALAHALNVPVTALFRGYEKQRDVTMIKAGEGLVIERRGSGAGHQYQLLGHTIGKPYSIEPYVISITDKSVVFPVFQHAGTELIYMLEGKVAYRHANKTYELSPGDSLFFDAEASHGPEEILTLPCRYLSFIVSQGNEG
ncbi:MAG: transcriptional regulator with XRE-family HTH domain [Gammaproteobacteria bacterium]|jgi:transcriptional regulator with XRE-family HTH domain